MTTKKQQKQEKQEKKEKVAASSIEGSSGGLDVSLQEALSGLQHEVSEMEQTVQALEKRISTIDGNIVRLQEERGGYEQQRLYVGGRLSAMRSVLESLTGVVQKTANTSEVEQSDEGGVSESGDTEAS